MGNSLQKNNKSTEEYKEYTYAASKVATISLVSVTCLNLSILIIFVSKYYNAFVGVVGFIMLVSSWFMLSLSTKLVEIMHNVFHNKEAIIEKIEESIVKDYLIAYQKGMSIYLGIHCAICAIGIGLGGFTVFELGLYGDIKIIDMLTCFMFMVITTLPKVQIFLTLNRFSNWLTEQFILFVDRD